MRQYINSLLIFLFFFFGLSLYAQTRVDTILSQLNNPNSEKVLVVAHRGDWRNFPENSLAAIKSATKMGVDVVEVDVQRTKDGQFVLMHDNTLNRTTTGKGKVADWTLDSIRALNLKNGIAIRTAHRVATLEEALNYAKDKVLLNLDKADRYFDEIFLLLQKTGTTHQIIMKGGKSPEDVRALYGDYFNDVIYMPIINLDNADAIRQVNMFLETFQPIAFEFLFSSNSNETPKDMKETLNGRSLIWYNTLWDTLCGGYDDDFSFNDPDAGYGYLIEELGARIIQTDRPQLLLNYLKEKGWRD